MKSFSTNWNQSGNGPKFLVASLNFIQLNFSCHHWDYNMICHSNIFSKHWKLFFLACICLFDSLRQCTAPFYHYSSIKDHIIHFLPIFWFPLDMSNLLLCFTFIRSQLDSFCRISDTRSQSTTTYGRPDWPKLMRCFRFALEYF